MVTSQLKTNIPGLGLYVRGNSMPTMMQDGNLNMRPNLQPAPEKELIDRCRQQLVLLATPEVNWQLCDHFVSSDIRNRPQQHGGVCAVATD